MNIIYLLLYLSLKIIAKADRKKYEEYQRDDTLITVNYGDLASNWRNWIFKKCFLLDAGLVTYWHRTSILGIALQYLASHFNTHYLILEAKFSGHVVGGVEVPITMYPHVAVLIIEKTILCGGSVVSDRVIVTAGHCVISGRSLLPFGPEQFQVYLGSADRNQGKLYNVRKVVPHEAYHKDDDHGHPNYFYDIAVLMLSKRIKFGQTIQKVKIASNESWRKEKYHFTLAGFGLVETDGPSSIKLLATRMHYVDSRTCNQSQADREMIVPDHMFCMIGHRWTSDCFGDSGSGVIWRGHLVGLVSTGRDSFCGADMLPSMYTDVTFFRKWVYSYIKEANALTNQTGQPRRKLKKTSNR